MDFQFSAYYIAPPVVTPATPSGFRFSGSWMLPTVVLVQVAPLVATDVIYA